MIKILFKLAIFLIAFNAVAQNSLDAVIKNAEDNMPLLGANAVVAGTNIGSTANIDGEVTLSGIPDGAQKIVFSFVGFAPEEVILNFPRTTQDTLEIFLQTGGEEMDEVIIQSTRSRRSIADLPTRVEVISGEELTENPVISGCCSMRLPEFKHNKLLRFRVIQVLEFKV
jgi:iron complex outermembrane receptor protein